MYGYIYKTTNLINNKIYIGQKKASKFLGNKYLGSGKRLAEAVDKYGKDNFKVEMIEEALNEKDIDKKEMYWISYYKSTDMAIGYNICEGGRVNRACKGDNNPSRRADVRKKISETHKRLFREGKAKIPSRLGMHNTEESKRKQSENAKINPNYGMRGKKTSEQTKNKIRLAVIGKPKKSKGYVHITNDIEDSMVSKDELQKYLDKGWRLGRRKFSKEACKHISEGHKGKKAHNKGKMWINNGSINKTVTEQEFDNLDKAVWSAGMLKRKV